MKKLIIIFLIVLSVLAYMQIKGWIAEGGPLLNVTNVVVPKGASLKTVAEELSRAGVIDKPWLFRIMARINGLAKHLKAGEYQFMPGISLQAAMDKIARGEVFFRRITIPEGLTSGQIMYLIANYPDLEGEIDLDVRRESCCRRPTVLNLEPAATALSYRRGPLCRKRWKKSGLPATAVCR